MPHVPAIIYAAKSTADEHGSIPTQVDDCQEAITREGGRLIIGPFQDEASSGFSGNRGQGLAEAKAAAVEAAAAQGWKVGQPPASELWAQHSDRFTRGDGLTADHLAEVFFAMRRVGVQLRSVQDDALLQPATVGMAGEQNTGYSKRLRATVTSGKDRQMERGHRLGGPVPDGLRVVVERDRVTDQIKSRNYVRDDSRAPIIEEAFALSEAGHGDSAVAKALNRRGHRTQPQRIVTGKSDDGEKQYEAVPPKAWSRRRVQDTLTNQTYAGRIVRHRGKPNEEVVPATNVEVLIDPARFDAMQAARANRDRSLSGRERARERGKLGGAPTLRYALSRLATCARCGQTMQCQTSPYKRKDGSQKRNYVCANRKGETGLCDAPLVDAEAADAAIVPHIAGFFDEFAKWSATVTEAAGLERQQIEATLGSLTAQRAKLAAAQPRAHERYTAALADDDDARAEAALEALTKIKADTTELDEQITERTAALGSLATEAAPSDAMLAYWHDLAESIRGRLTSATALADVNAELRVALERVEIDTRDDGKLELRAVYKRRGTWENAVRPVLDADGQIPADPDYEIDWTQAPTFVPDDVLILTEAGPQRKPRAERENLNPAAVEASVESGNHTQA